MKCCPPSEPLPGGGRLGDGGDRSPARGLRRDGEPPYEDQPLLGLVGQDSCCSKEPPLKRRDLRPPSAQERRGPGGSLWAGLGGLSARLEEKDLRRAAGGQAADGEEALELRRGTKEEKEVLSSAGEPNSEENEGEEEEEEEDAYRAFRGWGVATLFVQTFTDTPIGGGERMRGLGAEAV